MTCTQRANILKVMPSKTEKQRRYMGMDLARARAGKKTKTGMSERQLADFATKIPTISDMVKGAPKHA